MDGCCEKNNKYIRVRQAHQPHHALLLHGPFVSSFCIFYANATSSWRIFWISSTFPGGEASGALDANPTDVETAMATAKAEEPFFSWGGRLEFLLKCAFAPLQSSYRNSHVSPLTCDSGIADMTTSRRNQQQRSGEEEVRARAEPFAPLLQGWLFVEDVLLKVKCQDVRRTDGRTLLGRRTVGREGGRHRG